MIGKMLEIDFGGVYKWKRKHRTNISHGSM